jgi:Uma2 family endonuclease
MASMSAVEEQAAVWPPRVDGAWTVEDLLHSPDDGQRYEILDGVLLVGPAPIVRHQGVLFRLGVLLDGVCPADHQVFVAPLDWQPDGRTSLQPDVLVVRRDRLEEKSIVRAPTIVAEVLSPSTARFDRTVKMSRYAEGGIAQYWLVDPDGPSVQVFDLIGGEYRLVATGGPGDTVTVDGPVPVSFDPAVLVG